MDPLVSIIVPAYNSGKYINQCVDSVLNQTYSNWELIVVCAPSRDDTLWRLTCYENELQDPRLRIIVEDKKTNVATARNKGLKAAKGEYITFLDADDWWEPTKIQECIDVMRSDNELLWMSHALVEHYPKYDNYVDTYPGHSYMDTGGIGTCMFSATLFEMVYYCGRGFVFDQTMGSNDDAEFILYIKDFPSKFIKRYLTHYRQTEGSITSRTSYWKRLKIIVRMGVRHRMYGLVIVQSCEFCASAITRPLTGYSIVGLKKKVIG